MKTQTTQPNSIQENPNNRIYIVNLSMIHRLLPVSEVLNNFAKLYYDYASGWLYFEWLKKLYSKAWVVFKYLGMCRVRLMITS